MDATEFDERRLGRYRLVRELGRGGSGLVYEAELQGPMGFRKPVALKVLHGVDESARQSLLREARLGALVSHPNVVGTYEFGEVDGACFLAMELVRGTTVSRLVRAGPLPGEAIVDIGLQVCAGLGHIHSLRSDWIPSGLVHQDVKPQNLLLDLTGLCKLADLGVARLRGQGEGGAAGTYGYLAPEQLEGEACAASDLFGLGVVLYALAARRLPFGRGPAAAEATRTCEVVTGRPGFWDPIRGAVPGLEDALARCLRRRPEDRFQSAAELAVVLERVRARQEVGPSLVDLLRSRHPEQVVPDAVGPTSMSSSRRRRGNLTAPGGLVGRRRELETLRAIGRRGERVVSVVGPAGVGKSRLAVEAAASLVREHPGGAWHVDGQGVRDEVELCAAVASPLRIRLDTDDAVLRLGEALRSLGPALLVLDDVDHATEALRRVVPRWLEIAPELRVWATSRRRPFSGDAQVRVGPLDVDDAVALFEQRSPRELSDREREAARTLCDRLDGLPLAIDLAAARTRLASVPQLLERLTDRFRVLSGGQGPERHRSLRVSLDDSWDLLSGPAREAMAQLSVFADAFCLEAAEAVLDVGESWALDLLAELIDHSLLRLVEEEDRFRMLPTIRDYAASHLPPSRRRAIEARHAAWYAQLGSKEALIALDRHGGAERHRRLAQERENLLVALDRAISAQRGEHAAALALAVERVLDFEGRDAETAALLDRVLALPDVPRRVELLLARGWKAQHAGDLEANLAWVDRAEALAGDHDSPERARCDIQRGLLLLDAARGAEAERCLEAALAMCRRLGYERGQGIALSNLGLVYQSRNDFDRATVAYEQALGLHRRIGNLRSQGITLGNLGYVHVLLERLDEGEARLFEALEIHRGLRNRPGQALVLLNLSLVAHARDDVDEAERLLLECLAMHRRAGHLRPQITILGNLGVIRRRLRQPEEAERSYREALELARRFGARHEEARLLGNLGNLLLGLGRWQQADEFYAAAAEITRELGDRSYLATLGLNRSLGLASAGRLVEAVDQSARGLADPDLTPSSRGWGLLERASLLLTLGRYREALEQAREAAQLTPSAASTDASRLVQVMALALGGDARAALQVLSEVGPSAPPDQVELTCGVLARRMGRLEEARSRLQGALALAEDGEDAHEVRLALAHVLLDLGELGAADQELRALQAVPHPSVPQVVERQVAEARLAWLRGDPDASARVTSAEARLRELGVPPGEGAGRELLGCGPHG